MDPRQNQFLHLQFLKGRGDGPEAKPGSGLVRVHLLGNTGASPEPELFGLVVPSCPEKIITDGPFIRPHVASKIFVCHFVRCFFFGFSILKAGWTKVLFGHF